MSGEARVCKKIAKLKGTAPVLPWGEHYTIIPLCSQSKHVFMQEAWDEGGGDSARDRKHGNAGSPQRH